MALIRKQCAALPYRPAGDGVEILLVTSRGSGRWIIPKGWPMAGRDMAGSAAREAYEEAGILGAVGTTAIGMYRYQKRIVGDIDIPCEVSVFPLLVERELRRWPEQVERTRKWFGQFEAAALVDEPDLRSLLCDPLLQKKLSEIGGSRRSDRSASRK